MDLRSEQIFSDNSEYILKEAAGRYGISCENLKRLGSFESFVYEYEKENKVYILKITHSIHRTAALIQGELEWVNYLAADEVAVTRVVHSINKRLFERIEVDSSFFLVYSFEKAPGQSARGMKWSKSLIENWGQTLGRMHRLTKSFIPSQPEFRRFQWYEDYTMDIDKYIPSTQPRVLEKCRRLKEDLYTLPTDGDAYGLIHCDLQHGNFFIDDGQITVFDFDDCQYHWFAFDIAIPLFYVLRHKSIDSKDAVFARNFMSSFLDGYRRENKIEKFWLERIPLFLKVREMQLYIILLAENAGNLNDWCRRFMNGRRESIENESPIIDLDFTNL